MAIFDNGAFAARVKQDQLAAFGVTPPFAGLKFNRKASSDWNEGFDAGWAAAVERYIKLETKPNRDQSTVGVSQPRIGAKETKNDMQQEHSRNILDELNDYLGKFVVYPNDHCRTVHTLWIVHTHLIDAFYSTPRLHITSATSGCG